MLYTDAVVLFYFFGGVLFFLQPERYLLDGDAASRETAALIYSWRLDLRKSKKWNK